MGRKDLLNLFNANPPHDDRLLTALFCDRERETALGLDKLASRTVADEILAVYGETRSGKSHFVRVLLHKLPAREASWRIFTVNANHRGAPRPVLEDVFLHLWGVLPELRGKVAHAGDGAALAQLDEFAEAQEQRRRLLTGEYAERTRETSEGVTESVEAGAEAKLGPGGAKLGGRHEARRGESEKVTARAPSDADVVEWIRDLLDGLAAWEPARPVLLCVDDLDLLHRRGQPGSEASSQLVDRLKAVAEHPHAQVLVTIRAAYFNGRDKDFYNFIKLPLLDGDVLRDIYRRHVDVLHDGFEVLTPEALDLLVAGTNGQVGMFLKTCHDLFQWGYGRGALGVDDVTAYVDHELRQLRLSPECVAFMPAIEGALRAQRLTVEIKDDLQDTPLLHSVLLPIPGQPGRYLLNGIWSRALLRSMAR